MSTLTENLQTIYEVKQQLKQVIGTSSDIFEDYPSYISNMVTPTGTINISENGTYDVTSYAYAYVAVSGGSGPSITSATQLSKFDEDDDFNNCVGWVNGSIDIIDSFSNISYWTGEIYVAGRVPRMRAQNLMRVSGDVMPWYKDVCGVIDSSYAASYAYLIGGSNYLQFGDIGYYRLTTGATEAGAAYIYVDSVSAYTTITSVSATDYNGDEVTCTDGGSYFEVILPAADGGTSGTMIYVQLNNENIDPVCIAIHNGLELQSTTPHSINCLINPDGGSDFYIAYNQAASFTLHIPKTTTSGIPENLDENADNYAGTVPVVAAYLASVNF